MRIYGISLFKSLLRNVSSFYTYIYIDKYSYMFLPHRYIYIHIIYIYGTIYTYICWIFLGDVVMVSFRGKAGKLQTPEVIKWKSVRDPVQR